MATPNGKPKVPHLSGQLFQARLAWVKENHGPRAIERLLAAMDPEEAARLRGVERAAWYPFATFVHLDQTIARTFAPADPAIFEHLGEASASHRTEWLGEHAALVSVHAFLARAAEDHHHFHDFGHAAYHRTGFTEGALEYSGYPEAYEVFCRASRGYFRRAVEILTRGPVQVEEPLCQTRGDGSCLFRVRWQARPAEGPAAGS